MVWASRGPIRRTSRGTPSARRRSPNRKRTRSRRGRAREHGRGAHTADQRDHPGLHEAPDGLRRPRVDGARRQHRPPPRRRPRRRHPQDLLQRGGLLPLRAVDPRRGRLPGPVDRRQRCGRDDPERRPDGAADDDRRRPGRLGAPDHRRHALVRLRPPGQEVGPARADLGADRRQGTGVCRGGPGADHGPPRGPGAGLLQRAPGPHDGDADADPVRLRPGVRRGGGDRLARRRPREDGAQLRPPRRLHLGRDGEGAPRPPGRRDRLRGRRRARARQPCSSTT